MAGHSRKLRKTFTLSAESVAYLREIEKEKRSSSSSAVLEDILQEKRREQARACADASISKYYDSLSTQDEKENEAWAEIADSQFPLE